MSSIPALHVRMEGLTASFRLPLTISGTQISVPMPSYSTLLGIISACAGRVVKSKETRIGFEFRCQSRYQELERKDRLALKDGTLKPFRDEKAPKDFRPHIKTTSEGPIVCLEEIHQGIGSRQVYWHPTLDLYITNVGLKSAFENPAATPSLGRSQDIAWIVLVRELELQAVKTGKLGPTLLPRVHMKIPGLIVRLPEWIDNSKMNYSREIGPMGIYQAMNPIGDKRYEVEGENLYHPSDAESENQAIYLHQWLT